MPALLPERRQLNDLITTRQGRSLAKEFSALEARTGLELVRVRSAELVEIAKLESLETSGHVALAAITSLSVHERAAAEMVPHAIPRLQSATDTISRAIERRLETLDRRLG